MSALIRYAWSDTLRSQRWIAPLFLVLVFTAIVSATSGDVLPSYSALAALMLFVATWLGMIFSNSEDPVQFTITATASSSATKVRLSKLIAAYGFTVVLGVSSLVGPPIVSTAGFSLRDLLIGVTEILVTAFVGVVLGSLCSRPIVRRTAWAFLLAVLGNLVFTTVPHLPPTSQFIALFSEANPQHVPVSMLVTAAESIGLAAVLLGASIRLARARS